MTTTLSTMRSRIADDLNRDDLDTQIDKAINRAITFYEKEEFWFKETTGSFNTIANQQTYGTADGVPTDIKLIYDDVKIVLSSSFRPKLRQRTFDYIQQRDIGSLTSQPLDWCWYQNKIYLYPPPNGSWQIILPYLKLYTPLSQDTDTNDFLTYAEDLIEARASWWLYTRLLKDYDAANIAKAEETESLQAMREKSRQYQSTNKITATHF